MVRVIFLSNIFFLIIVIANFSFIAVFNLYISKCFVTVVVHDNCYTLRYILSMLSDFTEKHTIDEKLITLILEEVCLFRI